MRNGTLKYSFEIEGICCGHMHVHYSDRHFRTVTEFHTIETGRILAEFEVDFDQLDVVRARKRPFGPVDFTKLPAVSYPDCAYPLLIERSFESGFDYACVDLEQRKLPQPRHIARNDNEVVETRDGQVLRRFILDDGVPSMIDWGGASSNLLSATER